jgi:small subunit ribosomal protein S8e
MQWIDMSIWHGQKGRKKTGGLIHLARKKRLAELGRMPVMTRIGAEKRELVKVKGGSYKSKTFAVEYANILDKKTNQTKRIKILDVVSNPASADFVRMKILTRGAVIKTELGNARVLSRPSHGVVNAILV